MFLLKILVMSDSHGSKNNMLDAVSLESPDVIIHLGDNIRDCTDIESLYPEIMLRSVRGNCDRGYQGLDIDEFTLDGLRFFATHGHLYNVKLGKHDILYAAKQRNTDVLLFGHTHVPYYKEADGLAAINPGSISSGEKTYAVLELKNGTLECEHKMV